MDVEKACREDLVAIATAYAEYHGKTLVTISKKFHGRTRFMTEFRDGRCTVGLSKLTEIVLTFTENWPRDLAWPKTKVLTRIRETRDGNPQASRR